MRVLSNNKFKCGLIIAGIFSLGAGKVFSQDKDIPKELYTAAGIPDSLKEDANSIIRYSSDEVRIKGPGKAVIKHHSLITILNEKADKEAIVGFAYNRKYDTYSDIDIRAYDASGKLIKKYHKSDMYDGAAYSDETLVTDDRFLALKHTVASYPETIEVIYEEDKSSYINLDPWVIQSRVEQSVQNENYAVWAEPAAGLKYQCKNISVNPEKGIDGPYQTYKWQIKNVKAIKEEEEVMTWKVLPIIKFSQNKFDCYGYPGDMSTWQNYGKWVYDLNKDVCTLSPQRVEEIKKMTDTIKSDKLKTKFLYEYMQKSMRYVSIDLGIGGFKPFDANFVDQKKYGDCKALANYMYALLKAVNIPSYWAVIRRGENEYAASPDFPFNSFNHEILCVPFKNDTTWLECTGTKQPFGTLDESTLNRNALLITEDGGKLVNTPKSKATDNQFNSTVHIQLQPDGSAKAHIMVSSTGEYRLLYLEYDAIKLDEQKQFWLEQLQIKQPSVFDLQSGKDAAYTKQVNLDLEFDKFCDVMTGDKQFYRPAAFKLWANTVPILEKRKSDFYWEYPRIKTCTTTIDLPTGFEVETMPANANLKFSYGNYEINYVYNKDKNQVISTAKFELDNQVIPAQKYTEMQQYLDGIAKAQNKKLVIKKKA